MVYANKYFERDFDVKGETNTLQVTIYIECEWKLNRYEEPELTDIEVTYDDWYIKYDPYSDVTFEEVNAKANEIYEELVKECKQKLIKALGGKNNYFDEFNGM